MAMIGTIILVDQLPNASLMSFTWFLFGIMYAASRIEEPAATAGRSGVDLEPPETVPATPVIATPPAAPAPKKPSVRDHFLGR